MRLRWLLLPTFLALACSEDQMADDGGGGGGDAGFDSGVHPDATARADAGDAGVGRDAAAPDARPNYDYGRRLASVPADLLGLTPDEAEVIYLKRVDSRDRLYAIPSGGGATREIISAPTHIVYYEDDPWRLGVRTTRDVMWMMTNLTRVLGESGRVRTYRVADKVVSTLTGTSAKNLIAISPDAEWAIATDNYAVDRATGTATRSADIVLVDANGTMSHPVIRGVSAGIWDTSSYVFGGACAPVMAWTSSITAAVVACPLATKIPNLYVFNRETLTTSTVAENVTRFVQVNPDFTFFFWADRQGRIWASQPDGLNPLRFTDTSTVREFQFLDHRRFVFNTTDNRLKVSAYPEFRHTTLQEVGVREIRRVSPLGDYVMFSDGADFISTLFLIPTSTPAGMFTALETRGLSYPGDDAFSADGERIFWYEETNPNLIGDIKTRRTDGTGPKAEVTRQAYWVYNYANPDRVLLMLNSREISTGRITSDLATRARDGTDAIDVVAGDLLVAPRDFIIFPNTSRIVYHVPEGPNAGLWVRALP